MKPTLLIRRSLLLSSVFLLAACGTSEQPPVLAPADASGTGAPSAAPTTAVVATPATAAVAPGEFSITAEAAVKAGLPSVGFRVKLTKGGWSIAASPSRGTYLMASGPPGGPQTFLVKAYNDGVSDQAALEVLFKQGLSDWSGLDPIVSGTAEQVTLGGKKLEAMSFRTGQSLGTTGWCMVKAPMAANARSGALFLFGRGTGEKSSPSCKAVLEDSAIAEAVSTLSFL